MINGQTKVCYICKIEKPISEFYHQRRSLDKYASYCKACIIERGEKTYLENIWETSHRVPPQPGKYMNDWQKENTANILKALGWQLNGVNGIWYKLPMKNKFNEWVFPKKTILKELNGTAPKRECRLHTNTVIAKRKITLQTPPVDYIPKKKNVCSLSNEKMNEIRKLYTTEKKMTQPKLAEMFGVSQTYIHQIIHYKS
jgi:hypothetical protein